MSAVLSLIAWMCVGVLQSLCYLLLLSESWLTPAEVELTRWASNNSTVAPPKQVTRLEYKQATALEVLVRMMASVC